MRSFIEVDRDARLKKIGDSPRIIVGELGKIPALNSQNNEK